MRDRFWYMLCFFLLTGCLSRGNRSHETVIDPAQLKELDVIDQTIPVVDPEIIEQLSRKVRESTVPQFLPAQKFNMLVLSGGGSYGAYSAGILYGWSESGHRPSFDVVTGVSTGAIVSVLAFLGPERDGDLRRFYTSVRSNDIFRIRRLPAALFSSSIADTKPLQRLILSVIDAQVLRDVAAEHAKGRRLYVGTTHLDSRRFVVWDMGAIATRGGPENLRLFQRVVLASASIPGFFPPVELDVEVDGHAVKEYHVDGGVSASLFFRSPRIPSRLDGLMGDIPLYGSNMYIIVAGKLFSDPSPVNLRFLNIAADSISALLYSQTRGDLFQLFTVSLLTGMNYYMTSIPADLDVTLSATDFEPVEMTKLFEVGRTFAKNGTMWRTTPPGVQRDENAAVRGGSRFVERPLVTPKGVKIEDELPHPQLKQTGQTK